MHNFGTTPSIVNVHYKKHDQFKANHVVCEQKVHLEYFGASNLDINSRRLMEGFHGHIRNSNITKK